MGDADGGLGRFEMVLVEANWTRSVDVLVATNQAGKVVMKAKFVNACERLVEATAVA